MQENSLCGSVLTIIELLSECAGTHRAPAQWIPVRMWQLQQQSLWVVQLALHLAVLVPVGKSSKGCLQASVLHHTPWGVELLTSL